MQTLYIDVYFLVNFTVNYLSAYFAIVFAKVPSSTKRLFIASLVGALIAVVTVLLPEIIAVNFFIIGTDFNSAIGYKQSIN